ncbi:MAG TPA: bile acid:sodium symporter family protein [Opitutaceae bacterium]
MKGFLQKNWFVLALPATVGLAWLLPGVGASGGWLRTEVTTKLAVAVIFFSQGLTLPAAALKQGALQWKLHVLVQSFTFLLFPLLGLALDALLGSRLAPDLRLGFLYLCVLPSTISTSVVLTTVAGGNTAGAIFNAVLSNVLGVFITPLWVTWLMQAGGQSQPLGPVVREIIVLLLVPLVLGQAARSVLRAWADARKKRLGDLNSGLILFIVFAAFCNSVEARVWSQYGFDVTLVAFAGVIIIFALATGLVEVLARLLRLDRADRIAASFCAPQKTLASGVPLAKVIFGAHPGLGLILLPIMFYHPLQLLVCGLLAGRWAKRREAKS